MKKTVNPLFIFIFLMTMLCQVSFSQQVNFNIKPSYVHKKAAIKVDQKENIEKNFKNKKIFTKNPRGSWTLEEDFESGIFPPSGWTISFGGTEWQQEFVSGYGSGNYCTFYENYDCNFSNNIIYSPQFGPTTNGDQLIFDYAYAPYDDGFDLYYDDLEIYYSDDYGTNWYSLEYISGVNLQTATGTANPFVPAGNEWGTKQISIPAGATNIYFQSWENCANNLYIDNIKVGYIGSGYDASVEKVWAKGKLPLVYGVPDTIKALIKNVGGTTMNNHMVYLDINGGVFEDSVEIVSLNSGDTLEVRFSGFSPGVAGIYNVLVSLQDDDNLGNNTGAYITNVNTNTFTHVDSNCCNSGVGWYGEYSFINKYRKQSAVGQVNTVNIKITGDQYSVGQIIYAIVLDQNGVVVGKSPHYKIKSSDLNTDKPFPVSDPKPFFPQPGAEFYVGLAQTQNVGEYDAYGPQQMNWDSPAAPDANYYSYLGPIGSTVYFGEFPRSSGLNYANSAVMGNQLAIDAGVSDLGLTYEQYFSSTSFTPTGKVFNAGTGSATFTVNRKITPGSYSSTKTVTGLAAGGNANVTFDPWTFTPGTEYTIRDSVVLSGDLNTGNNVISSSITPRIAKQLCVLWQKTEDKDSLVRSILADGRYANNFDTVRINYTGSYRPWKMIFMMAGKDLNWAPWVRDSLKAYLDNSTSGNKKSLIVFGDAIAYHSGQFYSNPADTIFLNQYMKTGFTSDDWPLNIPDSENKFRGIGFFDGITQDSISDPSTPDLISAINGGSAACKPKSVIGNGNDSCIGVSFAGANYNTFFMSNKFASLRATTESPLDGPVLVYTKIIDWLQSISTGAKVLDLTMLIEGFYDPNINAMVRDTVKVIIRSAASPFAKIDSAKAYLSPSGQASIIFNNVSNGVNYLLQIKHRSGLETWSKTGKQFSSNHMNYNFTDDITKAYGDNMIQYGAKWTFYTGDVNQDGVIEATDVSSVDNDAFNFETGYKNTDVNGDGIVEGTDFLIVDNNAFNFITKATPLTLTDNFTEPNAPEQITDNSVTDEIKIDNEIYEKTKNSKTKDPKFNVLQKGNDFLIKVQ